MLLFLTKHLRIHWRKGEEWFWDTLVDADLANNAVSWQWVAGSGVDAAPYFRNIFNVSDSFNVLVGGTKISAALTGSNPYLTYNSTFPTSSSLYGYVAVPAGEQEIKLSAGVMNPDSITIKRFTKVLDGFL